MTLRRIDNAQQFPLDGVHVRLILLSKYNSQTHLITYD